MGSSFLNTPYKPWTPADAVLRDCSQGICSFYCPQWCSVIYPPPPSPSLTAIGVVVTGSAGDDDDSSSSFRLSPLIVALIGILASAFVLITYYTIISRFCTRRTRIHQNDTNQWVNDNDESAIQASSSTANTGGGGGLDDAVIRSITVYKYKKGDGLVEGTDCSVCLSEFQDCESLRLLPKCNHAFHLPCIDTWLRSHASCPLCRSNIVISNTCSPSSSSGNLPNQRENSQFQEASRTQSVNVSALEYQHRNDTVIVIHGSEQEIQVGFAGNLEERNGSESNGGRLLLVADVLRSSEDDEDEDEEVEIGSTKQNRREEQKRKVRSE